MRVWFGANERPPFRRRLFVCDAAGFEPRASSDQVERLIVSGRNRNRKPKAQSLKPKAGVQIFRAPSQSGDRFSGDFSIASTNTLRSRYRLSRSIFTNSKPISLTRARRSIT